MSEPEWPHRLAELEAQVARLETDVQTALDAVYEPPPVAAADKPAGPVEPEYSSLEGWVIEHFAELYARHLGGEFRWCASWWAHAEAISRLEALWRSWETLRLNPTLGMATWYRDHLDQQLPILLGQSGPFAKCTPDRHTPARALPIEPSPDRYWDEPTQ